MFNLGLTTSTSVRPRSRRTSIGGVAYVCFPFTVSVTVRPEVSGSSFQMKLHNIYT